MAAGIPSNQLPNTPDAVRLHRAGERQGQLVHERHTTTSRLAWRLPTRRRSGFLSKLTGGSGAIRAGFGMAYDRFGSDLVTKFDNCDVVRPL